MGNRKKFTISRRLARIFQSAVVQVSRVIICEWCIELLILAEDMCKSLTKRSPKLNISLYKDEKIKLILIASCSLLSQPFVLLQSKVSRFMHSPACQVTHIKHTLMWLKMQCQFGKMIKKKRSWCIPSSGKDTMLTINFSFSAALFYFIWLYF